MLDRIHIKVYYNTCEEQYNKIQKREDKSMTKKTHNKMEKLFTRKLNELLNLVSVYDDLSERRYCEIKLKINLEEIRTLSALELFELMVDTFSATTLELYFNDMLTVENYRQNRRIVDVLYVLIGGREVELKNGL